MSPVALGLVMGAVVLHASWNVLLKTSADPLRLAARGMTAATLALSPVAAAAWLATGRPSLAPEAVGLAFGSAVLELIYFVLLSAAYRRGEVSVVYPIARGTAPLLAVLFGVLVLRERLSTGELLGVAVLLAGIGVIRGPAKGSRAVVPALLTGVAIASYSSVDAVAVRMGEPWLYAWLLWAVTSALLLIATLPGAPGRGEAEAPWSTAAQAGALMTGAYVPILFAFSLAPLAMVAPLRESAIVLVAAWGILRLRERSRAGRRMAGAGAVLAGVVLLAAR